MAEITSEPEFITTEAHLPKWAKNLFLPKRYKVLYGGRAGGKSWTFARVLIIKAVNEPLRVLCAREFMSSLKESVKKLLEDQIYLLGLQDEFTITKEKIVGKNGSEFVFAGIKNNIQQIKSFEGIDICWVEEAANVSKYSWDILIPTIRKDKSELWVSFNPELEKDDTYQRFVINPPKESRAYIAKIGWRDNKWFNDSVLEEERTQCMEDNIDDYMHIWEGQPRKVGEGSVYTIQLAKAFKENRVCEVNHNDTKPVYTFWDLGWADKTAIWFAQIVDGKFNIIDYEEGSHLTVQQWLKKLNTKGYMYHTHWLPHDARQTSMESGRSKEQIFRELGANVRITPGMDVDDRINQGRVFLSDEKVRIDENQCSAGLQSLAGYIFEYDKRRGMLAKVPKHDKFSHGADSWGYMALALKERQERQAYNLDPTYQTLRLMNKPNSWMNW